MREREREGKEEANSLLWIWFDWKVDYENGFYIENWEKNETKRKITVLNQHFGGRREEIPLEIVMVVAFKFRNSLQLKRENACEWE